jgi:hypothetical protein
MGLLDKVKEQAATATAAAKDAAHKGQSKLEDIQANRSADGIFRDLGVTAYAVQTSRGTDRSAADIDRLCEALQAHEAAHGPLNLTIDPPA